jgi:hypothetical protein
MADIFDQYCLTIWCLTKQTSSPFTEIIFINFLTLLKMTRGLFDFATLAQSVYPCMNATKCPWYARVIVWLTTTTSPNHYNSFGYACRLANTIFSINATMNLYNNETRLYIKTFFLPLSFLYAWYECVQTIFVVIKWRESVSTLKQQGIECNAHEIDLLRQVYALQKICVKYLYIFILFVKLFITQIKLTAAQFCVKF